MEYSQFWEIAKDFQTLIASLIGLSAVATGIFAVVLQQRFHKKNMERSKEEEQQKEEKRRLRTAITIQTVLEFEKKIPQESLFEGMTRQQIANKLEEGGQPNITTKEYLDSVLSIFEPLSDYPKPISERVVFIIWALGRISIASSRTERFSNDGNYRGEVIYKTARDIQINLDIAIAVVEELEVELEEYVNKQSQYEKFWSPTKNRLKASIKNELPKSKPFNVEMIRKLVKDRILSEMDRKKYEGRLTKPSN